MKSVLIDTSCIVALLDRSEREHKRCTSIVPNVSGVLITCEAVIAESCYLLRNLHGASDAILENIERGVFQVPFDINAACPRIRQLMKKYRDVPIDFADACLIYLAEEFETSKILTLDKDFAVYRFGKSHTFENLLSAPNEKTKS